MKIVPEVKQFDLEVGVEDTDTKRLNEEDTDLLEEQ